MTGGAVPKHSRIRESLATLCRSGLSPDDAIPSERELMATFDVSRATIRRAIGDLVTEGLLVRSPGRGTFVARPPIDSHLHLASFTDDMDRRGHVPSTRRLRISAIVPPSHVADFFGTPPAQRHWHLERLRLADGEPMAHEVGWYNARLAPSLDEMAADASLYATLADRFGLVVDSAEQYAYARCVEDRLARLLDVPDGHPVLAFDRRAFADGRPVETMTSLYRGDRYRLHMSLDHTMSSERATPMRASGPRQKGTPS